MLDFLWQILSYLAMFVFLPLPPFVLLYVVIKGQIGGGEKDAPSPFSQRMPNPTLNEVKTNSAIVERYSLEKEETTIPEPVTTPRKTESDDPRKQMWQLMEESKPVKATPKTLAKIPLPPIPLHEFGNWLKEIKKLTEEHPGLGVEIKGTIGKDAQFKTKGRNPKTTTITESKFTYIIGKKDGEETKTKKKSELPEEMEILTDGRKP